MARRALGPATLAVVQAVSATLSGRGRPERPVLVAVSGGADSLALAAGVGIVTRRAGIDATAVVVDHALQPGSAEVAAATVDRLRALGYQQAEAVRTTVVATMAGPEADARSVRYRLLTERANERDADLLLGHTRDDQAETVLLGLARGSGLRSLAGMAAQSPDRLRPLLGLSRAITRTCCEELGLSWWEDPHNSDPAYARVRVRRQVLPMLERELGPGIAEALARTAQLARDDADLLDELAAAVHPDTETLDCAVLAAAPAALRRRVLRRWLVGRGSPEPAASHVLAVEALVCAWRGQQGIDVPAGTVRRLDGRLGFSRSRNDVAG